MQEKEGLMQCNIPKVKAFYNYTKKEKKRKKWRRGREKRWREKGNKGNRIDNSKIINVDTIESDGDNDQVFI